MKPIIHLFLIFLLFSFKLIRAADYDPSVLGRISDRVLETKSSGKIPVLVFDIDDTLTDSRRRTLAIFKDYAKLPTVRQSDPEDADLLADAKYSEIKFSTADTLASIGIKDQNFIDAATRFWVREFFSNDYCAIDPPVSGAAKFVNQVHRQGGLVVYLTGRVEADMQTCTHFGLMRHHFASGEGTLLLMKPSHAISDLDFKKQAFSQIRGLGDVVAGFENEPANINAYQEAFPEAQMVFLDTIQSSSSVVPNPGITWIPNFSEYSKN